MTEVIFLLITTVRMKINPTAYIAAATISMAWCGDVPCKTLEANKTLGTKEKVAQICRLPDFAKNIDSGEIRTPRDVVYREIDKENAVSFAEVLIAPGRKVFVVVRFTWSFWKTPSRIQIFEKGTLLAEKMLAPYDDASYEPYVTLQYWFNELFGWWGRINMSEYMRTLLKAPANKKFHGTNAECLSKKGEKIEKNFWIGALEVNEKVKWSVDVTCSWETVLHGEGEREWTTQRPYWFLVYYKTPDIGPHEMPREDVPYHMKEKWFFEDNRLARGSRTFYFGADPNPYVETGTFIYTSTNLSGNLYNGKVKLANWRTFSVVDGIAQKK